VAKMLRHAVPPGGLVARIVRLALRGQVA
jgi:hypothetical protein